MNLYKYVSDEINKKLGFIAKLETPKNRDFGDFSTNAAMVGAKTVGKNPRELANEFVPLLKELDFVADVSVAGPGFINIKIKDDFLLQNTTAPKPMKTDKPLTIDMDYGAYNVAKSLHIGHLRTSIVGDTLNRMFKFLGHKTFSWNHIGDWGKPMGLVIAWIERLHPELPYFQDDFDPTKPVDYDIDPKDLDTYYPSASALAKQDPEFQARAQEIKAKFQNGHPGYFALYEKFLAISLKSMNATVQRLNILPFDYDLGERNAAQYIGEVEKILNDKHMIYESDGALCINVKRDTDNAPIPPYMWQDSRGADTYDTTDLCAVYCRKKVDNPDTIIYFTDLRQSLHFEQLFRVADISGIYPYDKFEHIGYGTVNGKDGKPFKTRDGNAANLNDIFDIANEAVRERVAESGKKLDDETITSIALAAVKFNDLLHDVKSDYIFEPASVTSFEGRTGPYILYTAVRLNSVLKRANAQITKSSTFDLSIEERNLLIEIMDFEHMILTACDNRATDMVANYTYDLCQLVNNFYHNCPILRDDIDETTKQGRLYFAKLAFDTLSTLIDLMGLKIPSEM